MNIGMVHLDLAVESGDPRMFYSIAQGIRKRGHTVTVYTDRFDANCFPDLHRGLRVTVTDAPPASRAVTKDTGFLNAVLARYLKNRLQDEGVARIGKLLPPNLDLLVCQNNRSYKLGVMYKKKNPKARVVWIMNNAPFYYERKSNIVMTWGSAMMAALEKHHVQQALPGIDLIVVHDEERRMLGASLGKPTLLIPIPVDFDGFYQPVKTRASSDRRVTFLDMGSLSPARKFEDIIRAAAVLRDRGYDARVLLACKDVWRNDAYKQFLLALVRDTHMEDRVTFYFDGVSESELRALQRTADFFVFPNHIVIWSMASFEAMAAGLPLLISRVTSVTRPLHDGKEALFFDPGNIEQIADCAEALIRHPDRYKEVAEAGQRFVKKNLSWESYIERFLAAAIGK